nr:MAG TPA: hypothetical protein [Caudoviricetes sp.]
MIKGRYVATLIIEWNTSGDTIEKRLYGNMLGKTLTVAIKSILENALNGTKNATVQVVQQLVDEYTVPEDDK